MCQTSPGKAGAVLLPTTARLFPKATLEGLTGGKFGCWAKMRKPEFGRPSYKSAARPPSSLSELLSSLSPFNSSTMSGAGKSGGKGGRGKKAGGKSQSRSARAGLQFPVGRVSRQQRQEQAPVRPFALPTQDAHCHSLVHCSFLLL